MFRKFYRRSPCKNKPRSKKGKNMSEEYHQDNNSDNTEPNAPQPEEVNIDAFFAGLSAKEKLLIETVSQQTMDRLSDHWHLHNSGPFEYSEMKEGLIMMRKSFYLKASKMFANKKIQRLPEREDEFPLPLFVGDKTIDYSEHNHVSKFAQQLRSFLLMNEEEFRDFVGEDPEVLREFYNIAVSVAADTEVDLKKIGIDEAEVEDDFTLPSYYEIEMKAQATSETPTASGDEVTMNDLDEVSEMLKDVEFDDED